MPDYIIHLSPHPKAFLNRQGSCIPRDSASSEEIPRAATRPNRSGPRVRRGLCSCHPTNQAVREDRNALELLREVGGINEGRLSTMQRPEADSEISTVSVMMSVSSSEPFLPHPSEVSRFTRRPAHQRHATSAQ